MAIVPTSLTAGFTDTDGANAVSASITLPANALILAALHTSRAAATTQTVSAASTGAVWEAVNNRTFNSTATPRSRVSLFRTMVTSDQTGIVIFSTSSSHDCWIWSIISFAGVDTTGTNGSGAIVQSAVGAGDIDPTWGVTLAAFGDAVNNATYIAVSYDVDQTFTPNSPLTALNETNSTAPTRDLFDAWNLGENLSPSGTTSGGDWGGVAVEIKASAQASMTPTVDDVLLAGVAAISLVDFRLMPTTA